MNRPLSEKDLKNIAENLSDLEEPIDPFHDSDDSADPDFECSDTDSLAESLLEESEVEELGEPPEEELDNQMEAEDSSDSNVDPQRPQIPASSFDWTRNVNNFVPKYAIPPQEKPVLTGKINKDSSVLDCFFTMFPKSLMMQISHYTNLRLKLLGEQKKKKIEETSPGEIKVVLGCALIMSYNRLPAIHMYWSKHKSLGNLAIREAISRDRFLLLMSKLYFNEPNKPNNASKVYYIEEVISCLKKTFLAARSDSTFQSIDESMTKFKGRTSLKQYLPLKPVKRGIKLWTRCDSVTGYVYDTNIYSGKETEPTEGTLGQRVVLKLAETIKNPNVTLCFDRFFTSTLLLNTIKFPCVGTFMSNRKNTPKFEGRLERGECEMLVCKEGMIATRWKDTKDVLVMSSCHDSMTGTIKRKMKDGSLKEINCPEAIIFYNQYMGGVDHADQMITLYELDRRSNKWWKKVFFRMLMTAVFNSFIIYTESSNKKITFINFVIELAESLISVGRSESLHKRTRKQGRVSKRVMLCNNIGDHLPVEKGGRNRCVRCKNLNIEKRTKIICCQCQVPLCVGCFTAYHT